MERNRKPSTGGRYGKLGTLASKQHRKFHQWVKRKVRVCLLAAVWLNDCSPRTILSVAANFLQS